MRLAYRMLSYFPGKARWGREGGAWGEGKHLSREQRGFPSPQKNKLWTGRIVSGNGAAGKRGDQGSRMASSSDLISG